MKKFILLVFLSLIISSLHSQVPNPPTLFLPINNATGISPDSVLLDWSDVAGVQSYRVQVYFGTQYIVDISGLTNSQYQIPPGALSQLTNYYWHVNVTTAGGTSAWSSSFNFTTGQSGPSAPILMIPANGSVGVSIHPMFDWNAVPGATAYILHVSKSPLFDSLVVCDTTSLATVTLEYNTHYYWRMCAMYSGGVSSWSTVFNFYTMTQVPDPPTLLSPADSSTIPVIGQIFDWSEPVGAVSYRIQISTSPTFATTVLNQVTGSASQYTVSIPIFQSNTMYYWRVNATNAGGTGGWSSVWRVITQAALLPAPVIYPLNRGKPVYADSSTIFEWHKMSTATSYRIQISTTISFLNPINEIVYDSLYIAPPNTFSNNTTYYWRVAAINNAGQGNWTAVWSFTVMPSTPGPPNLLYPQNNSVNISLTPILNWSDVIGATSYRIHLSTSPPIDTIVALSEYAVPPGKLNYYTTYYWRIASINISGQGQFSTLWNFRTINQIGIKQISSEIPAEYKLYNNYPNPFNPNTNIKYQITNSSITSLVVYDVLGKEMAILVNEYQSPGIYEVLFDSIKLSSGIYFYRLQSGDFVDTKKMLMIK